MIKRLALILLFIFGNQNVNAALSVSRTVTIHAPIPTSVTCNIQDDGQNYYCDLHTNNLSFKTVSYYVRTFDSATYTCPLKNGGVRTPFYWSSNDCSPDSDLRECGLNQERYFDQIENGIRIYLTKSWHYYSGEGEDGYKECYYGSTMNFYY